jgi:hypothetical protein
MADCSLEFCDRTGFPEAMSIVLLNKLAVKSSTAGLANYFQEGVIEIAAG